MHQIKTNHSDHHHHEGNISFAFFLNLGFTVIEIIGGLWTNSMAILSDAVHDLGDSVSLGLAWYLEKVAKKGSDRNYSYGYKRFSLLGAIINSVILTVGSVLILIETVPRIIHPQAPDTAGMFILAIMGVIINSAAMIRLRRGSSVNEKVVSLHMLEDVLGWSAILVGSVVMHFFDLPIIDPILSIAISLFILYNVYKNLRVSMRIILQGTPPELDADLIREQLKNFPEVESAHDLHSWSIDGEYHVATLHIVLRENTDLTQLAPLKSAIRDKLKELNISHATIEFETAAESCSLESCSG